MSYLPGTQKERRGMGVKLCPLCFTPYFVRGCPVCHGNEDFAAGHLDCWNELVTGDDDGIQHLLDVRRKWRESRLPNQRRVPEL